MIHPKVARSFNFVNNVLLGLTIIWLVPLGLYAQSNNSGESKINIISANIRVALKSDIEKGHGWDSRKELAIQIIKEQNPDIICLQEVLRIQNEDFKEAFPDFFSFGFEGPEMDPHTDGGYYGIAKNPILFNKSKFQLIAAGQYWLSDEPHIAGSMSWGTARARHVNWLRLKEISTGNQFRVLNTHLDHKSIQAQVHQAKMIVEESNQYEKDFPQILAGDFNSDQESTPIIDIKNHWIDTYGVLNDYKEPGFTVHGFIGEASKTKKGKVDFIFIKGAISTKESAIVKDKIDNRYPSDHYFVTAELIFN